MLCHVGLSAISVAYYATGLLSNVNAKKLSSITTPLAPINEQKRVADKLDSLLTRVDKCRDRLAYVEKILQRFRQSVLALAVSGKITLDWRKSRLRGENDNGILPTGWKWQLMKEIGNIQLGRQRAPKYHHGQHMRPYLRVQNVFEDKIDFRCHGNGFPS